MEMGVSFVTDLLQDEGIGSYLATLAIVPVALGKKGPLDSPSPAEHPPNLSQASPASSMTLRVRGLMSLGSNPAL